MTGSWAEMARSKIPHAGLPTACKTSTGQPPSAENKVVSRVLSEMHYFLFRFIMAAPIFTP